MNVLLQSGRCESSRNDRHCGFPAAKQAEDEARKAIEGQVSKERAVIAENTIEGSKKVRRSNAAQNAQLGEKRQNKNVIVGCPEVCHIYSILFFLLQSVQFCLVWRGSLGCPRRVLMRARVWIGAQCWDIQRRYTCPFILLSRFGILLILHRSI